MPVEVNGELISNTEIREQTTQLRAELESAGREVTLEERLELRSEAIGNLIDRTLMAQEARRLGLAPSQEDIERTAADLSPRGDGISGCRAGADTAKLRGEAERRLLLDRLLEYCWGNTAAPSQGEIRKYYRANCESFAMPEMVRASHLVRNFEGRDRAAERERVEVLRERILAGENFGALAAAESDCPENGGNLGWFPRGVMVEEFDDVVFAATPGAVTDVFETRFGAHVAMVHARRQPGIPSLEELTETIERRLRRQKLDRSVGQLLVTLRSRATIREVA